MFILLRFLGGIEKQKTVHKCEVERKDAVFEKKKSVNKNLI